MNRPARSATRHDLLLALPALGAGLALARGHAGAATVLAVLFAVAVVARIVAGPRVHLSIAWVVRRVERILTWIAVALLWCLVVVPGWLFARVRAVVARPRRRGEARRGDATRWVASPPVTSTRRSFAAPTAAERTRGSMGLQVVGLVVALLVVDVVVGVGWQRITRSEAADSVGVHRDGTIDDPRADSPALAGAPWAADQLRALQRLPQAYWPLVGDKPLDFASDTINVRDWARRSYEPTGAGSDVPVVAFFGGSTTFGEGQRDEHTIPSEVARLAEAAGTPVRVVNYGQRAWATWQEALLFDQVTADPEARPDLVVFYDGWNEVELQRQSSTAGWPTTFGVDVTARTLTGHPAGSNRSQGMRSPSLVDEVGDWYTSRSMIFRVARRVRSALGDHPRPAPSERRTDLGQVARDAASVYLRAIDIVEATAQRRGIDLALYWQPSPRWRSNVAVAGATRIVSERAAGRVEVIADALDDHQDVYFDAIHTNEQGARIVAERIWETLAPKVAHVR